MTEREIFKVKHKGAVLNCRKQGFGPLLLMIHGVACDGYYFDEAARRLEDDYTVVTYDRRGYSDSYVEEDADMSVQVQAEDVLEILDYLDVEKAYICGSSAGALIAIEFLRQHPERIEKLFLHEPPLGIKKEFQDAILSWLEDLKIAAEGGKIMRATLVFIRELGGTDKSSPTSPRLKENIDNLGVFLYREIDSFLHYGEVLPKGHMDRHGLPVIVMAGAEDVEGLFSRSASSVAEYLNCDYGRVPGYHNFPYDRPWVFAYYVEKFFE